MRIPLANIHGFFFLSKLNMLLQLGILVPFCITSEIIGFVPETALVAWQKDGGEKGDGKLLFVL